MEDFCGSVFWDGNLTWNTDNPDFTPCFQMTALVWAPCVFFLVLFPLELYYLKSTKYFNIPWGYLNIAKLIFVGLLTLLSFIDLGMAVDMQESQGLYSVHIVSPIIKIITFAVVGILIFFSRKRGLRTSGVLFLFWFTLSVFAIPQYRTEIVNYGNRVDSIGDSENITWEDYQFVSYMIYFPLTVICFILSCLADLPANDSIYEKVKKNPSPELSAGFFSKLFFNYFDAMAWKGYKNPLTTDEMWDSNPDNTSKVLIPTFDKYWHKSVGKAKKAQEKKNSKNGKTYSFDDPTTKRTNGSIIPALLNSFGGPFWFAGVLKLIIDLLSFASPQILKLLIGYTATQDPLWKGIVYTAALFGSGLLSSLLNGAYQHKTYIVGFRARSALVSAIYKKALNISNSAKKETTVGEIVNLMAVDAQRFFETMTYLHILWAGPLQIAIALYFLWDVLGPSSLAGFVVMLFMFPFNGWIATRLRYWQIKQMKKKDERVKTMNEVLNGMKVLKLYAWEPSFEKNVNKVRDEEMDILKTTAYYNTVTYFLFGFSPFLVTLASFAVFVLVDPVNNVLNEENAFVALSLFNILRFPMTMFPMVIAMSMQTLVAVERINKFMNSEELDPNIVSHEKSDSALDIKDATFNWGDDVEVLKDINLKVPKKELAAVVGPVGCGKSSLVMACLGEMEKTKGYINTDGRIAYVPQQAWIQNSTLKDNILFGKPLNQEHYDRVIEACALKADLDMLPGGDKTEIGEKGINLSGGQKQRISLARAVYNDAEIYFLDDPLSAVDAHVGKHIFDHVIGPKGILAGKTRILVTHGISFLPQMDTIIVIKNGEISESGNYQNLLSQKGAFSEFLIEHLQEMNEDDDELIEIKKTLSTDEIGKQVFERAMSHRSSIRSSTSSSSSLRRRSKRNSTAIEPSKTVAVASPKDVTTLIEKEESATGSVGFGVYIRYFKGIGLWCSIIGIVMNIGNQTFSVLSNNWLSTWSADRDNTDPAVRDMYLGVYGAFGVAQAISSLVGGLVLAIGCLDAARDMHDSLLNKTMRLPMSFFDTTPLGRVMNRFSKDVDMADNTLPMSVRTFIMMFFSVISVFVVISTSTPIFMAVIVPIGIIYYFIQAIFVATSRQLKRIESVTRSPIYSHFSESISGQLTIRAYDLQESFITASENKVDFNQICAYPGIIANRWLGVRLEIVGSFVILFAALFAVLGRGSISPAIVGLSITYALQITQTLSFLVRMTAEVETNIVAVERMEEYTNLKKEAEWEKGEIDTNWPREGKVDFVDYKVRYREGLELVLKGINFSISGSQKVGIVGRTGAGKSSLTLALFRIIESAGGKILIDGKDIAELGLHNLRQRLTIIPQDPVLFSGTLRMNIDPFDAYPDERIWEVLEHSHLKAFVKDLPTGLMHVISEGGENLSVGQRQLICLARALLRKTKILILDEATAAIDLDTDDLIQNTIRTEFKDCTILTIAHRLNTIIDSDKVVVLDKGMVAEFDTPAVLLADKNSIFYGMAKKSGLV